MLIQIHSTHPQPRQLAMVIDGGIGGMTPSTVVDCTTDEYHIIRQGAGVWDF